MEGWGAKLLDSVNRLIDKNAYLIVSTFLILFSFDSMQIYTIPISWIAIVLISAVSIIKLFTYSIDTEIKIVLTIFGILLIQHISSFISYDSYDQILSQHTFLRYFNFVSFFICFLFVIKSGMEIDKTVNTILVVVLFSSTVGVFIYFGQLYDFFDVIRNRPGTGIYGQEEQVTFWLSENHRAMGTFREPIFLTSFLLPLTFIGLWSKSRLVSPAALLSGYLVGLTRSDFIFFAAFAFFGILLIALSTRNLEMKSGIPIIIFFICTFIGYSSTVRECDVNKSNAYCPSLIDIEAPVWTSDPISFASISSDSFDILWGHANDNEGVASYQIIINDYLYMEIPARQDQYATNRITYPVNLSNSKYDIEIIAIDKSDNSSINNPRNSITIGDAAVNRPRPEKVVENIPDIRSSEKENSNNYYDKVLESLGEERLSIVEYVKETGTSFTGVGILNANYEYTKFFSNKNLISNYLTIRTSPEYMSVRYKAKPFGTGDTYYLYGSINLQNLLLFNYIAHGAIFLVLAVLMLLISMKLFLNQKNYLIYIMLALITVLMGVFEELSSFQGVIFGIIYSIYKEKEKIE